MVVVLERRVVAGSVVGDQERPASAITAVLVALMQEVAVEVQSISWLQLNMDQG